MVTKGIGFTHLHAHTDASLLDGLGPVERTVNAAAAKGFQALAITDHGTLANAVSFVLACKSADIKPIIGLEGYVLYDESIGHITVLADGDEGFDSLVKLNNMAHASPHKRPAFTIDQLIDNYRGLVVLSGCVSSPFNTLDIRAAIKLGARLKDVFESKFFIEVMFVSDTDTWTRPIKLSEKLNVPLVLTNDVHFPYKDDVTTHTNLTLMKAGFSYHDSELWLKTGPQLLEHIQKHSDADFGLIKAALERSYRISKIIKTPTLARAPIFPETEHAKARLLAAAKFGLRNLFGIKSRGPHTAKQALYMTRAKDEMKIISNMGYEAYFLMLKKLVDYAKEKKVAIGPGRGSGAGSLLLYLLGVTEVDPIKYDLPFERFLNPDRAGMPDVDIDFEQERRHVVLDFAIDVLGATQIATYSRYQHRMLVSELAKVYRVPPHITELAKDFGEDSSAFDQICENFPGFSKDYEAMLTQIRHKGKHAAGIVFQTDRVPIERLNDGTYAVAWTEGKHNDLSYVGMVKFDLLGLSAMSVIRRLRNGGGRPNVDEMVKDKRVWRLFRDGRVSGIFQFEGSAGIRELVMKLEPESVTDLAAASALYRPGALDAGATEKYPEWKKKPRKVPSIFKLALSSTYGAIVFQEQMMQVFAAATGGSLAQADLARRVLLKTKEHDPAWWRQLGEIKALFINGAIERGFDKDEAESWWEEIQTHSRYSFNKAHAVSYAIISLEMAWWKIVDAANFYAQTMNVDPNKMAEILAAAVVDGIHVSTPFVNTSSEEYETDPYDKTPTIYLPLSSIKYLGIPGAKAIVEEQEKGLFKSVEDFMKRVPKRAVTARARLGLFNLGGFNGLYDNRDEAIEVLFGKKFDRDKLIDDIDHAQVEHLGFIIPRKEHIDKMVELTELGWTCGFVARKRTKVSSYGPYVVYTLSPAGSFWHRASDYEEISIGTLVAVMKSPSSGKMTKIKIL